MAKVTVTLKRDAGYDSPWMILKADSPQEMYNLLKDPTTGVIQRMLGVKDTTK